MSALYLPGQNFIGHIESNRTATETALKATFSLQERGAMARDKLLAGTPPSFPVIVLQNARIPLRVKPPPILPAKHYLVDIDVSPR